MFTVQTEISPQDLTLIKKTALYTSQYSWFTSSHKFTQKGHSLNPLFRSLVHQYEQLLTSPPEPTHPNQLLTKSHQAAQEKTSSDAESPSSPDTEKDRIEFAQIDWQAFTVVETVKFTAKDYTLDLPLPLTAKDIEQTPLDERGSVIAKMTAKQEYLVSPFTGEKIKASEYDQHVKVMNLQPQKPKQPDAESNLYYDDVEENLRKWKRQKQT